MYDVYDIRVLRIDLVAVGNEIRILLIGLKEKRIIADVGLGSEILPWKCPV